MLEVMNNLIGKPYNRDNYHCWNFIEEVFGDKIPSLNINPDKAKICILKYKSNFIEIDNPINFCLVVMDAHIGIYYNNYIYHNSMNGVVAESTKSIKNQYKQLKYYKNKEEL